MISRIFIAALIAAAAIGAAACEETCVGDAKPCPAMVSYVECAEQEGCFWQQDQYNQACLGSATECDDIDDEDECKEQRGCSWE